MLSYDNVANIISDNLVLPHKIIFVYSFLKMRRAVSQKHLDSTNHNTDINILNQPVRITNRLKCTNKYTHPTFTIMDLVFCD